MKGSSKKSGGGMMGGGKKKGGGGGGSSGGGGGAENYPRDDNGNLIIPIPHNSIQPAASPTVIPVFRNSGSSGGTEVNTGITSNSTVTSAPSPAPQITCESGSSYQAISTSPHCFGPGECENGCCLYPYCLCGEPDDQLDNVMCLEDLTST